MATIVERMRAILGLETAKAAKTQAPYAATVGPFTVLSQPHRGTQSVKALRNFADTCEPVRTAINWRKQQVSQARHRIVRTDDPKKPPDPRVVDSANRLLRYINPKRESFRSLLDMAIEDLLVLDAGCIEKEKTLGRPSPDTGCAIAALWAVDGGTINVNPSWDGRDPKAPRYQQVIDRSVVANLRNDELVYMMETPTTHRVLGLSRVEILVHTIEASLYGEQYAYKLLQQAAPPGLLHMGDLRDEQLIGFREYYESEIAGTGKMPIAGGAGAPQFLRFGWSPKELLFDEYRKWLIGKIAYVFQIDKTIFGEVDDVNRSTSKSLAARTDQGFVALARLVAEYITREIIAEIDENHGFEFLDLVVTDPLVQAKIDQVYASIGVLTPNEIRAERLGLDPVEWGDAPYNAAGSPTPDPLSEDQPEGDDPSADNGEGPSGDEKAALPEVVKNGRPFVATPATIATTKTARARTRKTSGGYLKS